MNYSSIATIHSDGIYFSRDILGPIGVANGAQLWAMYYPTPHEVGERNDIMLTPIPYEFWPVAGRLKIRIVHEPGKYGAVADYLAQRGIVILYNSCSRSSHRYSTFRTTIVFSDLLKQVDAVCNEAQARQLCRLTKHQMDALLQDLERDLEGVCFKDTDQDEWGLGNGVLGDRLSALQYFWCKSKAPRRNGVSPTSVLKPLRLKYEKGVVRPGDAARELLTRIASPDQPTRGFAEVDTHDMNLRVAIIARERLDNFATVKLGYEWRTARSNDTSDSSEGLLGSILESLGPQVNLWEYTSEFQQVGTDYEHASGTMVAERTSTAVAWEALESKLRGARSACGTAQIREAQAIPFSVFNVMVCGSLASGRFQDFVKICQKVALQYGIDVRVSDTHERPVREQVVQTIKRSSGMLQYYGLSGSTDGYTWLAAESLAAEVAGIPTVIIKDESVMDKSLQVDAGRAPIVIADNASYEDMEKAVDLALQELWSASQGQVA